MNFENVLELKRLLLSSPEFVYAYLESHAKEGIPDEISEGLIALDNRLINLGLARYSRCNEVLRVLFLTSCAEDKESLRCAIFANPQWREVYLWETCGHCHNVLNEECKAVLVNGNHDELQAMLCNKSMNGYALAAVFLKKGWAQDLSDDRWRSCVCAALCGFRESDNSPESFWEYHPSDVHYVGISDLIFGGGYRIHAVEAAWTLLEVAPTSGDWAIILDHIFWHPPWLKLAHNCSDAFFMRVLQRWKSDSSVNNVSDDDFFAAIHCFGRLRTWIGAYVPSDRKIHEWMASNEDKQIRMGHYYSFDTNDPTELNRYFERDGKEFVTAAVCNDNLYSKKDVHKCLYKLCAEAGETNAFCKHQDQKERAEEQEKENALSQPVTVGYSNKQPITITYLNEHLEELQDKLIIRVKGVLSYYCQIWFYEMLFLGIIIGVPTIVAVYLIDKYCLKTLSLSPILRCVLWISFGLFLCWLLWRNLWGVEKEKTEKNK